MKSQEVKMETHEKHPLLLRRTSLCSHMATQEKFHLTFFLKQSNIQVVFSMKLLGTRHPLVHTLGSTTSLSL